MSNPENLADLLFPARDARLASVVRALSRPETGPAADNLVSNEDSYPRVAEELARGAPEGGVYVGVGPDQNFTLIAHAKPRLAFIIDYRRRNVLVHLVHKALMSLAGDRVAYLARLTARQPGPLPAEASPAELVAAFQRAPFDQGRLEATVADAARLLRPLDLLAGDEWPAVTTIQAKLAGPGMNARFLALPMYPTLGRLIVTTDRQGHFAHFLARESLYHAVRALQLGDRLIPIVGDFGLPGGLLGLGRWLRSHSMAVSLLYVSDVEFFLLRAGRLARYVENLAGLPWMNGALIVRTSTREIVHPERMAGDSSTTIVREVETFLRDAGAGRITTIDDLFGGDPASKKRSF